MRELGAEGYEQRVVPIGRQTRQPAWDEALKADVLIFSKTDAVSNEELAARAADMGIRVIFDVCDNHYDNPRFGQHYRRMSQLADQVVCPTPEMAAAAAPYCRQAPVVIEDPYEAPFGASSFAPGERLKLLWFGFPLNLPTLLGSLEELAAYAARRPFELVVLTLLIPTAQASLDEANRRFAGRFSLVAKPWSLTAQWHELAECDAVIIPTAENALTRVKSPNRMVEALRTGRAVVAQPLPSYRTFANWVPVRPRLTEGLDQLEANRREVPRLVAAAQAYIEERHAPHVVAARWKQVILGADAGLADLAVPGAVR